MATIIPFKGIRPAKDKVHLVASRSVDSYTVAEIHQKLKHDPYTFLQVIHPDFSDGKKTKPDSDERLLKIKAKFSEFVSKGIFIPDTQPCYYIYRQQNDGTVYTGIIGCISIDDYFNGIIKVHEQTLTEREEKLKHYLEVCDFNAEPVLFSYPTDKVIEELSAKLTRAEPEYDFTTADKIRHQLWTISDKEQLERITERFSKIPKIYIADGHHRSASSVLLGKYRREQNPNYTGKEPFNYFLGIFFAETQLKIMDYNRVIKDLNNLSVTDFISKIAENFEVKKMGTDVYIPKKKHTFSMYLEGIWYSLEFKNAARHTPQHLEDLDAAILSNYILSPILHIKDLKTDQRIRFVSGIKGMAELKNQVDNCNFKVAFGLYPVEMEQLKHIADTNNTMPPKTTWIEPKLRSGLVIYSLSE